MEQGTWPQQIRSAPRGKILRRLRRLRRRSAPWRICRSALALRLAKKVPRQRKRNVEPGAISGRYVAQILKKETAQSFSRAIPLPRAASGKIEKYDSLRCRRCFT